MAITNNGTVNSLGAGQIPSGYTRPTVTTFTNWEYQRTLSLTVDKATVDNATASTTMTNIIGNATIGITKQITDILDADFLATATVDAYADWTALSTNYAGLEGDDAFLTDATPDYVCTVILYVKTS